MHRSLLLPLAVALGALVSSVPVRAGSTYIALGDSLTFGETNLNYVQSNGNRGYVSLVANALAARNGGVAPNVINLAIDGETSTSFTTGAGRVAPVVGRTDAILAAENTNYASNPAVSQATMFQQMVATQQAAGNTVSTVSITLGTNDLFSLFNAPGFTPNSATDPMLASTLATYQSNYSAILSMIRSTLPNATILVVGTYNPFPANPTNTFGPLAAAGGPLFNNVMQTLAAQVNAQYVNIAPVFVGKESALTYEGILPQNSSVGGPYGGSLPLGDVHPNAAGYALIANAIIPEPSSLILLGLGLVGCLGVARRRRRAG